MSALLVGVWGAYFIGWSYDEGPWWASLAVLEGVGFIALALRCVLRPSSRSVAGR
jgi:hypothetical protein